MVDSRAGRRSLKGLLGTFVVSLIAVLAFTYLADYVLLRYRMSTNRNPYGTVTVQPYYAVPRKDHKTEFLFDDPQDQTCVNSLFPHFGSSPCWYLSRNKQKRIDM